VQGVQGDKRERQERAKLFRVADGMNGNGILSFEEEQYEEGARSLSKVHPLASGRTPAR